MDEGHHEDLDERLLHRMLFFTDAVFAIALTLLVLELKPPETAHEATVETLQALLPHIAAFGFSFFIIGIFWTAHMNGTRRLAVFDWPTAVANLVFLLPISFLPFVTGWLAADLSGAVTWTLYCSVLVAISLTNVVMVFLAYRDGGRLIARPLPNERAYRLVRAAAPGVAFAVGLALLAVGLNVPAHFCWVLIPVVFRLARWFLKTPPAAASEPEPA